MGTNVSYMKQHQSLQERMAAARDLLDVDRAAHSCMTDDVTDISQFRLVVDQMDNSFSRMFNAHPDRVIFVKDGKVAYLSRTIFQQTMEPTRLMTHEARDWLQANL
ncbi:thyroxine 5-deiodinase-like [Diadema antillarum]|uniref:thyroxine 5-deiodinase-like n=1 Tax=Diadema antillarum TaxID=105358 RepID=UPI003A8AE757